MFGGPARQLELSLDGGEHRIGQLAGEGQHGLGQRAAPADHQRAVHRPHPAGLPALQAQRGGKADGANQAAADGELAKAM